MLLYQTLWQIVPIREFLCNTGLDIISPALAVVGFAFLLVDIFIHCYPSFINYIVIMPVHHASFAKLHYPIFRHYNYLCAYSDAPPELILTF